MNKVNIAMDEHGNLFVHDDVSDKVYSMKDLPYEMHRREVERLEDFIAEAVALRDTGKGRYPNLLEELDDYLASLPDCSD
ncbi:hypothetical protein [Adlercreutzia sp. ZJ154]|uniref:hypothetical protein n=1 Tax=Adlercreutzia sp. ZJ154 TaxID=2709790 RepID=UPI0013EC3FBD|nr:hypothetical protein [Adlercreutzia sp. ZJ154]